MGQTRKKARCQCDPLCKEQPVKGSPFCVKHMKNCPRKAPLSGDEGKYDPDAYNKHKGIQEANNCYAYAFGYRKLPKTSGCTLESCPIGYPQPGKRSKYPDWNKVKG